MLPKTPEGTIDKDAVKIMYMASVHIEWVKFAEDQGWNPSRTRSEFPVSTWVAEKKDILGKKAAEQLAESLFGFESHWHIDVLDTLNEYPKTADSIHATGKEQKPGNAPPTVTDEELKHIIDTHKIEEVRSFSNMYVSSRLNSRADAVRLLCQSKAGGEQVKDCKWKILALSLGDSHFDKRDVNETIRLEHPWDDTDVRLWSGVVWHSMYGEPGKKIYCGVEESLAARGIKSLTEFCHGFGLLCDSQEPWHAVVVSFFKTTKHKLESPNTERVCGDLLPLDLVASRFLFLNRMGKPLPKTIISTLTESLSIIKTFN